MTELTVDNCTDLTDKFLEELEEYIYNQTEIPIKLKYKPTEFNYKRDLRIGFEFMKRKLWR